MQRIIDIARSSPAVLLIQISRLNVIKTQQNKELVLVVLSTATNSSPLKP